MDRVAFTIFGLDIMWYGVLMALAMILCVFIALKEGKRVKITDIDNEIFEGIVSDYIYPEDNEPEGVAGICIEDCPQRPGDWIGFNEHDIKEIKITD